MISAYENLKIGEGVDRHEHRKGEPCHLTIVAAGAVMVTVYGDDKQAKFSFEFQAPHVIDYSDGEWRHHRIIATKDETTFYNVPRASHMKREVAADYLFGGG